ncbi:MAG: hypothetical protein M3Q58_03700 [Bacteroidota bacterium]|nr:hypothetical protein [Bacteroidota bacterium]
MNLSNLQTQLFKEESILRQINADYSMWGFCPPHISESFNFAINDTMGKIKELKKEIREFKKSKKNSQPVAKKAKPVAKIKRKPNMKAIWIK